MSVSAIPTDQLAAGEHNPRSQIDTEGEAFAELVASIREHGVLQPILVGKRTNGHWPIIAGHRRAAAAREAGLEEVPALEAPDLAGAELAAAITENVMREDLTPVEEAEALEQLRKAEKLKQADLAKRVGKSVSWVRGRLALLKLPVAAREAIGSGEAPLEAAGPLLDLTKQDRAAAEAVAEAVLEEKSNWTPAALADSRSLGRAVGSIAGRKDGPYLCALRSWGNFDLGRAVPDADKRAAIEERHAAIDLSDWAKRLNLDDEDVDAARAYGCLLEVDDGYGNAKGGKYATDPEWVADRLAHKLEQLERQAAELATGANGPADDEEAEWERQQREQEAEREKTREQGQAYNAELGSRLAEKLSRVEPTLDVIKVVALYALGEDGANLTLGPDWQAPEISDEEWALGRAILDAGSVEEVLGLIVRARLFEWFSAYEFNGRISNGFPPGTYAEDSDTATEIYRLVEGLGRDAKALPQRALDAIEEWERERAERVKAREEEAAAAKGGDDG